MKVSVISFWSLLGLVTAQSCPDPGVNGYATVSGSTTGGGSASPITVTTADALKASAKASGASVIIVKGTISVGSAVSVTSNKTIRGADEKATVVGGFDMNGVSNIIIKNLNIQATAVDGIASRQSHHIWYDHLNIWDAGDGLLDITQQSDFQTVSWCKFWYSSNSLDHRLASLVGSGGGDHPEDYGKLHVTYHHNWWSQNVDQRMPRVMYGDAHVYNSFYNSPGNSYCVGFGSYGAVLMQNNYFKDVNSPHEFMYDVYAYVTAEGNVYDNVTGKKDVGKKGSRHVGGQESFVADAVQPPYSYTLDSASSVPDLVKRCAGPRPTTSGTTATSTTKTTTSSSSKTTTKSTTATTTASGSCSALYGQCGGIGWTGPKCCNSGTCKYSNDYYSQCL